MSGISAPPQGILFKERRFSEPAPFFLAVQNLPVCAGLYAILIPDCSWGPRSYGAIYFGEAEELARRVGYLHERYGDWCRAAGGSNLYLATHEMRDVSERDRKAAAEELIQTYSPACNAGGYGLCRDALYEEVSRIETGTVTLASLLAAARNGK